MKKETVYSILFWIGLIAIFYYQESERSEEKEPQKESLSSFLSNGNINIPRTVSVTGKANPANHRDDSTVTTYRTLNEIIDKNNVDPKNGYHEIKYSDGVYKGMFKNGERHGKGIFVWNTGESFDGKWVNDAISNGKYIFANGDVYIGGIMSSKRHGYGQLFYRNGDYAEGYWKTGKRDGLFIEKTKGEYCGVIYKKNTVIKTYRGYRNYATFCKDYKSGILMNNTPSTNNNRNVAKTSTNSTSKNNNTRTTESTQANTSVGSSSTTSISTTSSVYTPPMNNNMYSNSGYSGSSYSGSSSYSEHGSREVIVDCYMCHRTGYCGTCNGSGISYSFMGQADCPNCINGRCTKCGGSGTITKMEYY